MSSAAYSAAWHHLDLGAMPIVLHVQHDPLTRTAAWDELDLVRGDEVDPWLAAAFKLLANPPRAVDLRLGIGRSAVRALAGSAGGGGVLAVLSGHELTVRDVDGDLVAELVALVPPFAAGGEQHGQFGAAVLDSSGRRRRAADFVDFHDTTTGRRLADGTAADAVVLRTRIGALLNDLDG